MQRKMTHVHKISIELLPSPSVAYRLSETFKAMWASNGNELSKIYAGTGVIGTSSKVQGGSEVFTNIQCRFYGLYG